MQQQPRALMSYTKFDDDYSQGQLTHLRARLSTAMRALTGEEFLIFQPHQDVQWGQRPQDRIRAALEQVYLFIPVITPSYFNDDRCREELTLFLEREQQLGRGDLVLPIRYLPTPKLDNPGGDALAASVAAREAVDWSSLRHADLASKEVETAIEQMAVHIIAALSRTTAPPSSSPPSTEPSTPSPARQSAALPSTTEQRFQTDLLTRHLQRLIEIDRQLVQHPDDIKLQMDRDRTISEINTQATALGIGSYPQDVAVLVQAAGLLAEYSAFLEHQRQARIDYQRRLKLLEVSANPSTRVNIQLQLQATAQHISEIEDQQAALLAASVSTPYGSGTAAHAESTVAEAGRLHAPMLPLTEVHRLLACADAVAQVSIGQVVRGQLQRGRVTGTAWLIAPDLALTCWHVLHARGTHEDTAKDRDVDAQAENCLLTFNFTDIGTGLDYAVERVECADRNSSGLDYALLRLRDRPDHPLRERTPLTLDADAPLTAISELYIIQHPRGMQQQGADGHVVQRQHHTRLHYTNNTAEGTSGAPVLSRPTWRVVALHHGSTPGKTHGEGIALRPILDDIQQQRPEIYTEIRHAQSSR